METNEAAEDNRNRQQRNIRLAKTKWHFYNKILQILKQNLNKLAKQRDLGGMSKNQ